MLFLLKGRYSYMLNQSRRGKRGTGGSVLILTLWVLFFLAALAVGVGAHVSGSMRLARSLRGAAEGRWLARAGVERAVTVLLADTNDWDAWTEDWYDGAVHFSDVPLGGGRWRLIGSSPDGETVVTNAGLTDEESRLHLDPRLSSPAILSALLESVADLNTGEAAALVSALQDWQDENDDPLADGAESPYYAGLGEPYPCRNGPMGTVLEVLLVKGGSTGVLHRIQPYVTLCGSGKINPNTASGVVLGCLAHSVAGGRRSDVESLLAKTMMFRASGGVFTRLSTIEGDLEQHTALTAGEKAILRSMKRRMSVGSSCFRAVAEGRVGDEPPYRVAFVYDRNQRRLTYWHEF